MFEHIELVSLVTIPYLSVSAFLIGLILLVSRRIRYPFNLSSSFLEDRLYAAAFVPLHLGLVLSILGHLIGFFLPGLILFWNSSLLRLYFVEIIALSCGILSLVGWTLLVIRQFKFSRLKKLISLPEYFVQLLLFSVILSGILQSVFHPWGTSWFTAAGSRYLWSLVVLSPELDLISGAPAIVHIHFVAGFLLIGVMPYTKLAHMMLIPFSYFWMPSLQMKWFTRRRMIRTK
jgi:nitrate reductase gamma subunit